MGWTSSQAMDTLRRAISRASHARARRSLQLEKATNIVKEEAKKLNLLIPNIFWGPINIAKCGLYAEESSKKILDLIK